MTKRCGKLRQSWKKFLFLQLCDAVRRIHLTGGAARVERVRRLDYEDGPRLSPRGEANRRIVMVGVAISGMAADDGSGRADRRREMGRTAVHADEGHALFNQRSGRPWLDAIERGHRPLTDRRCKDIARVLVETAADDDDVEVERLRQPSDNPGKPIRRILTSLVGDERRDCEQWPMFGEGCLEECVGCVAVRLTEIERSPPRPNLAADRLEQGELVLDLMNGASVDRDVGVEAIFAPIEVATSRRGSLGKAGDAFRSAPEAT